MAVEYTRMYETRAAPFVGVIEGFYGVPWSPAARRSMVRFLGRIGLSRYVYAPKNEPKHRQRWTEPYGPRELDDFAALVDEGRRAGVDVVFAVAPQKLFGRRNISATPDRDGDGIEDRAKEALLRKLRQLQGIGARGFALLFDDTLATFLPFVATEGAGRFHARIANAALHEVRRVDPDAELMLVPAIYYGRIRTMGRGALAYWRGLRAVDPEVTVGWTGPHMFSPRIRGREAEELSSLCERRLVVWNNAITNDWLPMATGAVVGMRGTQKLSFGPPENLDPAIRNAAAGVLLNGAREPELTKIAAACLAEWAADPRAYEPDAAHARAVEQVAGASAAPALRQIYELTSRHALCAGRRPEGKRLSERVERALRGGPADLRALVGDTLDAVGVLRRELSDHPMWAELAPTVTKVELTARAAQSSLAGRRRDRGRLLARALAIPWQVSLDPLRRL